MAIPHEQVGCTMFSTSLLEPRLRTAAYGQWIRPMADIHPLSDEPVEASVAMYGLDRMVISRSCSSSVRYVRNRAVIERGHFLDSILVRLSRGGEVEGSFGGSPRVEVHEGDIYLSDLSQPADIGVGRSDHVDLLVPRRAIDRVGRPLHGRLLRRDQLACRMLTQHLLHLIEAISRRRRANASVLSQTTLAVLQRCLGMSSREQGGRSWETPPPASILAHIESRLGDPDLDAAMLQETFRISRTQLYRLFADLGGIQHYIRERRLQEAFRALCGDPAQSISAIGSGCGFRNERQFQRAFRARFDVTASDVRKGASGSSW